LRAALLTRLSPNAALPEAAASILIERVTGFVALLAVAGAGALFGGAGHQAGSALIGGTGLLVVFLVIVAVMRRLASSPPQDTGVQGKLRRIWGALDFYLVPGRQKALLAAVGISLVFQVSQVLLNLGLAYAVGLKIPVGTIFWVHPLMQLAAMLPFGIGGLGVREAAAIQLLKSAGIVAGAGTALAWSLLWQATVWISSLPGAIAMKGK
jgi:uncharacterized membrane protein YbhN (UPF0104 family)